MTDFQGRKQLSPPPNDRDTSRQLPRGLGFVPAAIFTFLVLPALLRRGVSIYDEAHFLLAANTILLGMKGFLSATPLPELAGSIQKTGGTLYLTAKPGIVGLLALMGLVTGGGLTATKGVALGCLAGLGSVALLQSLVAKRFGAVAGLVAALLLATNPFFLRYAATALSIVPSIFFLLLFLWLLDRAGGRFWVAFLAGVAGFAGFTCHYNIAPALAGAGLGLWSQLTPRTRLAAPLGFFAGFLILQTATMGAQAVVGGAYPEYRNYGEELVYNLFTFQVGEGTGDAATAPADDPHADGVRGYGGQAWLYLAEIYALILLPTLIPLLILVQIPPGRSLLKRVLPPEESRWLTFALVLPLVLWSLYPWKVERSFIHLVPLIAALSGVAMAAMWGLIGRKAAPLLALPIVVHLGIFGIYQDDHPYRQSLYSLVVASNEHLIEQAPENTFTSASLPWRSAPLWKWYLGPERLNRGLESPGIDFSEFEQRRLDVIDPHQPDPSEETVGVVLERDGERWGFAEPKTDTR